MMSVYVWCRVLNLWNSSTLFGTMIPDDLLIFAGCCRHEPHTDLEDWDIQQHEHMSECWYQQKHGWFELSLFHFHGIQKVSPLQPMHILELGRNSQSTLEIRKPRGSWISCVFSESVGDLNHSESAMGGRWCLHPSAVSQEFLGDRHLKAFGTQETFLDFFGFLREFGECISFWALRCV